LIQTKPGNAMVDAFTRGQPLDEPMDGRHAVQELPRRVGGQR
jgi:hypothetical protein